MDLHSSNTRAVTTEVHDLRGSVILHEGPTNQDPSPTDQDAGLSLPLASDTSNEVSHLSCKQAWQRTALAPGDKQVQGVLSQ